MKTTIIIPTYNEKENITRLLPQILDLGLADLNILVVDDNSPDGTASAVEILAENYPGKINILKRAGKQGLGSAYLAGFQWALQREADLIFEMDADGSHNPGDIPRLINAISQGADVAIGSRRIAGGQIIGWGWHRHLASWGAMTVSRIILGIKTKDLTAGFRCFRSRVLNNLELDAIKTNGYAFQEEMIYRVEKKGFRVAEVPITFKDREQGTSKLAFKDIAEFFIILFKLRFEKL